MNFKPPPNHGTDAQDEDFELVDSYLLRVRPRGILPRFGSCISPEKNRSPKKERPICWVVYLMSKKYSIKRRSAMGIFTIANQ